MFHYINAISNKNKTNMKIQFENGTSIEVNTDIDSKTIEAEEIVSELIKQAYEKGVENGKEIK